MFDDSNERLHQKMLDEHRELRAAILHVREATTPAALAAAAAMLLDRLAAHIESEEQTLEPVIERIDAWGAERVRRLRQEHLAQRRALARLRDELATTPDRSLAWDVQPFVDALLADMATEERELLSALRDDTVSVEFGG
jgi:iron-sulfur cluster repair protein YtfE (RIC family)